MGILIALVGMIIYSYYCTREGQKKATEAAPLNQVLLSPNFLFFSNGLLLEPVHC